MGDGLSLILIHDDIVESEFRLHTGRLLGKLCGHLVVAAGEQCGSGDQDLLVHGGKASGEF